MSLITILIILLLLGAVGGAPLYGWHSAGWYPAGGIGVVLLVVVVLMVAGRI